MSFVYVNRHLDLKIIKYIGLDMDHTLVKYNSREFEALAYKYVLQKLVDKFRYPESILTLKFNYNQAIRGLIIDKQGGNLLKISCFGSIRFGYHGLQIINFDDYKANISKYQYVDLKSDRFDTIDTAFSISCASLFSQLVDLKDKKEITLPDYHQLADNIIDALNLSHKDGTLKKIVIKDLDRFIIKDENLVIGIERFVKHGKKIFILTNSDYNYTKTLLEHIINPFLKEHKDWRELFEYTITNSQKPRFFYDQLPFLKVDPETGLLSNDVGHLNPDIYQGGGAETLTNTFNVTSNEILYIGDNIYADILCLKKERGWRTGLVLEEIEDEINIVQKISKTKSDISRCTDEKITLEAQINELISRQIENQEDHSSQVQSLQKSVQNIKKKISFLAEIEKKAFNPYWGEVMRVGAEESYFAYQVQKYTCIYMGKLSDFFSKSPRSFLRSRKRLLAHDP